MQPVGASCGRDAEAEIEGYGICLVKRIGRGVDGI